MTNLMLDDDVLSRLLSEAAESFPVPDEGPGFVLEELSDARPGRRRGLKWGAAAAAVVAGVLVVQSLGGGGEASSRNTPAALRSAAGSAGGAGGPDLAKHLSDTDTALTQGTYQPKAAAPSRGAAGLPVQPFTPTSLAVPAGAAPGFEDGAKIVKTGSVALIVSDGKVSNVITKITGIAQGAGGYVASSKTQEYGDDPSSTVTVRVPVDRFEAVVQSVRDQVSNGVGKVDSSSSSGQDVTAQYADVGAQIQSLTAARNRFLVILERANTIGETLSVQQRVDSVQQQLDSLKGRLRVLKDQTSMGTLTVTVSEKAKAETKAHVRSGLSRSFDNAKHGFTSGVESLISKSGRGLLVLLVALVGLLVARTGWRLARRRFV